MKAIMAPHTQVLVSPSGQGIVKADRRASKPLMEKRRRERINKSLNELKSILLDALRKDSTCHSKLEKADILEMTVRYLRSIQRQRLSAAVAMDPSILNKYRAGYIECKTEVSNFLDQPSDSLNLDAKSRLLPHLGATPTPFRNLAVGSSLMTTPQTMPNCADHRAPSIQLPANSQMSALAAAASTIVGEAHASVLLTRGYPQRLPVPSPDRSLSSHTKMPQNPASPMVCSTHHCGWRDEMYNRKRSTEYISSLSSPKQRKLVPTAIENDFTQNIVGSFVVLPNFRPVSPPLQQVPCSPSSVETLESSYSYCDESPKSCSPSPNFSAQSDDFSRDKIPFIPCVKNEPQSPCSGSENGDFVWRPW